MPGPLGASTPGWLRARRSSRRCSMVTASFPPSERYVVIEPGRARQRTRPTGGRRFTGPLSSLALLSLVVVLLRSPEPAHAEAPYSSSASSSAPTVAAAVAGSAVL